MKSQVHTNQKAHQFNGTIVATTAVLEVDAMAVHVGEVLLGFFACTRSKTFVILDTPGLVVLRLDLPALKLRQAVERDLLFALRHLKLFVYAAQVISHGNPTSSNYATMQTKEITSREK